MTFFTIDTFKPNIHQSCSLVFLLKKYTKDDIQALENKNIIVKENTNHSEKLAEEVVEDKDHTERLEEGDNIFKVLLDMHEDVPLEDPGPSIASVDRVEGAAGATQLGVGGDVPLEDPGPGIASVDRPPPTP